MIAEMKWPDLIKALFGANLTGKDPDVWELELRNLNTSNEEICDAMRHISGLDYTPRADKERKSSKITLADLRLWIYIHRKESRKGAELLPSDTELGYRRLMLGKMRGLWESGRKVEAGRMMHHPELVQGINAPRPPSPEDSAWIESKAEEQFGYDAEEVFRLWKQEREEKASISFLL